MSLSGPFIFTTAQISAITQNTIFNLMFIIQYFKCFIYLKKKVLSQDRSQMGLDLSLTGPPYSRNASTAYSQPARPNLDAMSSPVGMYSDSEVTLRPVFGNRPLYAHPLTRDQRQLSLQSQHPHTQQRYHHQQAATYRSSDELNNLKRTSSGGVGPVIGPSAGAAARRASQHMHQQQLDQLGSESDSLQSPRQPHQLPATSR